MSTWNKEISIQNALELIMKGIEEEHKNLDEPIKYLSVYNNDDEVEVGISKIKFLVDMLEENFKKYKDLRYTKEESECDEEYEEDEIDDIPF